MPLNKETKPNLPPGSKLLRVCLCSHRSPLFSLGSGNKPNSFLDGRNRFYLQRWPPGTSLIFIKQDMPKCKFFHCGFVERWIKLAYFTVQADIQIFSRKKQSKKLLKIWYFKVMEIKAKLSQKNEIWTQNMEIEYYNQFSKKCWAISINLLITD